MIRVGFMSFLCILLSACKKPDERACLKRSGEKTKRIVNPGDFTSVYLKEHISYIMVQDTTNYVIINGGENLVNFIDCSITNSQLVISNNNKCKFLRYKTGEISVEIHFKVINELIFQGTELLTNRNIWNFDQINIELRDAGGSINLTNFNGNKINIANSHGWGDITLSGSVNYFRVDLEGNGYFD